MGFDRGSISFRVCRLPQALPENVIEAFNADTICALEEVKDEAVTGWVSGRNLLERQLHEGNSLVGNYLYLCYCQAQRRIPSALLNAKIKMTELSRMAERQVSRLPKNERTKIREEVQDALLPSMPVSVSGIWFVVDRAAELLYVTATSDRQLETFAGAFAKTVGFEPIPLNPETVVEDLLKVDAQDIPEINFSNVLADANAAGTLGQNFLTWLWFWLDKNGGQLPPTREGDFGMMIDGPLTFISENTSAQEAVVRKGTPTMSPDASTALITGKKLRQAKLTLARANQTWTVTLDADTFTFRGMKLPEGETYDEVSYFGERMEFIYQFQKIFFELFRKYVKDVTNPQQFAKIQSEAKEWAASLAK